MASINPSTKTYIYGGITLAGLLLTGLAHLTPDMFPSYINSTEGADIIKTSGILASGFGIIGAFLAQFSSSVPGAWAPKDPDVVQKATILASLPEGTHPDAVKRAVDDLNKAVSNKVGA
jgi:hypothetical protein